MKIVSKLHWFLVILACAYGDKGHQIDDKKLFEKENGLLKKVLEILNKYDNRINIAKVFFGLGNSYISLEQWDESIKYSQLAIEIYGSTIKKIYV